MAGGTWGSQRHASRTRQAGTRQRRELRADGQSRLRACKGYGRATGFGDRDGNLQVKDGGKFSPMGRSAKACASYPTTPSFEVAAPGNPPRGSFAGKCSEYDTVFGCFRTIPSGTRARGPVAEDEAAHRICVD